MKPIYDRRRARSGETLIETLVSTLVIGFSVAILCVMVTAAGNLHKASVQKDEEFYTEWNAAEQRTTAYNSSGLTARLEGGGAAVSVPVKLYGASEGLTSYGK